MADLVREAVDDIITGVLLTKEEPVQLPQKKGWDNLYKGINIKAADGNSEDILIGTSKDMADPYPLSSGEVIFLKISDATKLFFFSLLKNQGIHFIGV